MASAEDVLEELSGMIGRKDAERIAAGGSGAPADMGSSSTDVTDVVGLLEFINAGGRSAAPFNAPGGSTSGYLVDLKDRLYRVFNQTEFDYGNRKGVRREIVLGHEGKTIRLRLFDNLSRLIDTTPFERGDIVFVRNAALEEGRGTLKGINKTTIIRVSQSHGGISDFALLKGGERDIDIIGKVVEIGPVKYVGRLDGEGQIGVSNCIISDLSETINATLWGSSAYATANIGVGDFIKIEFCNVRENEGSRVIYATDASRVFSNRSLEGRMR